MVTPTPPQQSTLPSTDSAEQARVLIVDRSAENREVLRTVLQRSGHEIYEAEKVEDGLSLVKQCHPKLLVLDIDSLNPTDPDVLAGFDQRAREENASILLLGRIPKSAPSVCDSNVMPKPYHYGPLIRKIEELLRQAEPTR